MERLKQIMEECLDQGLYQMIISHPHRKSGITKVKIRPVMIRGELLYQESRFEGTKVFHENRTAPALSESVIRMMNGEFRQLEIHTVNRQVTALAGKKGNVTVKIRNNEKPKVPDLTHDRRRQYLLEESVPIGFLQDLGVQTREGRIVKSRYDKFRQINRFLEFIEDVLPVLPTERTVRIIDFGCGKSYLTFAMYYYLKILKQYDVDITGLDLKADVIMTCNQLSQKYGYEKLHFMQGDIREFNREEPADMVVCLHACDTATDHALAKAVGWGAKVILAVPCCQHELNGQMKCEALADLFAYGLVKEQAAALFTDALRGQMMESVGYHTQILEFIDMEHTPKNRMLRCIRREKDKNDPGENAYRAEKREGVETLMGFLKVRPTLYTLLQE